MSGGRSVIALTTDTAVLTSIGNDYGYETILRAGRGAGPDGRRGFGDLTSGASISPTLRWNGEGKGLVTIGLTGRDGGETADRPRTSTCRAGRRAHAGSASTLLHLMCELIEPGLQTMADIRTETMTVNMGPQHPARTAS